MELADILGVDAEPIPKEEYVGQSLHERVQLLPEAPDSEEFDGDLAIFLTAKQVQELARDYFLSGNLAETARKHKVRYPVALRASKEAIFDEELVALERAHKIGQKADLDRKLSKVLGRLDERLEHGDEVVTKDGIVRVAVKARDLAAIAAILTERREKLDEATRPAVGTPKGKLETLADQLRAKAAAGASNAVIVPLKQVSDGSQAQG
jgi:hypothetical protein